LLVLTTHVPLGIEVIRKGIIFVDLAIAQIAGAGVIFASIMGWDEYAWALQLSAVSAAVLGGVLFTWTEKRWSQYQEPLIGIFFVLAATGSVLLLTGDPHASDELKDILVGQILWVEYSQLLPVTCVYLLLLVLWRPVINLLGRAGFYLIFALSITLSVQIVGIYLVFASLIIPALSTVKWHGNLRYMIAFLIGSVSYVGGLCLSMVTDMPSAPLIVWCLAVFGFVAALIPKGLTHGRQQITPP